MCDYIRRMLEKAAMLELPHIEHSILDGLLREWAVEAMASWRNQPKGARSSDTKMMKKWEDVVRGPDMPEDAAVKFMVAPFLWEAGPDRVLLPGIAPRFCWGHAVGTIWR